MDAFRCSSSTVASGIQLARGWWLDPFAAGGSTRGVGHQLVERPFKRRLKALQQVGGLGAFENRGLRALLIFCSRARRLFSIKPHPERTSPYSANSCFVVATTE